jgi:aminoglycoside phosphotransferase (APT) family kinase protein
MAGALDDDAEERLVAWIEQTLSAKVVSVERQQRWRPCWFIDVRADDGGLRSLYVRGDRTSTSIAAAFETEYHVMRTLEAEGVLVPHIHGLCPDPLSIVMDRMPGRPDLSTAASDEERAAVLDQYMEVLAQIHAIDPAKFDGLDLPRPRDREQIALVQFDNYEALYRKTKRRPEPVLEFLIVWVRRNAPRNLDRVSFLVCDVAQFMFDHGRLTAVLDFEMAYVGDPMHDLAALQLRDTSEPLGDMARALRHYEAVTGRPIDAAAFDFHAIAWSTITPLSMTDNITRALPTNSVLIYLEWWMHFCRVPLELIAACTGRALTPPPPIVAEPTPFGATAESLVGAINAIPVEEGFAAYERATTANLAGFMARVNAFGPGIVRQDIADVEALLSARFESWQDAEAALERFVLAAGPEEDDRLIPLLYRRAHRQCQLLAPFLSRDTVANTLKTFDQLMNA